MISIFLFQVNYEKLHNETQSGWMIFHILVTDCIKENLDFYHVVHTGSVSTKIQT